MAKHVLACHLDVTCCSFTIDPLSAAFPFSKVHINGCLSVEISASSLLLFLPNLESVKMHSRRSLTSILLVVFDLLISLTYAVNCPVDSDCWKQSAKSPIAPEDYLHPLADGSVRTPRHETNVDINDRTATYNQIYDTAHTYIHDINGRSTPENKEMKGLTSIPRAMPSL